MPLKDIEVFATLEGAYANVKVDMIYANPTEDSLNCSFEFPLENDTVLSELWVKQDDTLIKAVVKEKEEANSDYNEAMMLGNLALLAERKSGEKQHMTF